MFRAPHLPLFNLLKSPLLNSIFEAYCFDYFLLFRFYSMIPLFVFKIVIIIHEVQVIHLDSNDQKIMIAGPFFVKIFLMMVNKRV